MSNTTTTTKQYCDNGPLKKGPSRDLTDDEQLSGMNRPFARPVTRYGINYAGTQVTQWDFQNNEKAGWTGTSSFVLETPLRYLRPSIIYSVPCDRIVQRAYK